MQNAFCSPIPFVLVPSSLLDKKPYSTVSGGAEKAPTGQHISLIVNSHYYYTTSIPTSRTASILELRRDSKSLELVIGAGGSVYRVWHRTRYTRIYRCQELVCRSTVRHPKYFSLIPVVQASIVFYHDRLTTQNMGGISAPSDALMFLMPHFFPPTHEPQS